MFLYFVSNQMKRYFFQCQLRWSVILFLSNLLKFNSGHWHLFRRKSSKTKTNCKIKRIRSLGRPVRLMPNIVYIILNENINFRIIKWCEPCVLINLYAYFSRFTCHQQKAILTKRKLTVNTFFVASIFVSCYSAWK